MSAHSTYSETGYLSMDHINHYGNANEGRLNDTRGQFHSTIEEILNRLQNLQRSLNREKNEKNHVISRSFRQNNTDGISVIYGTDVDENIIDPLQMELQSFYELGDNWDGDGAKEIPRLAIQQAEQFLQDLFYLEPSLRPTYVAASPFGEVVIYWGAGKSYKEVTFDGDEGGFFCFEENDQTVSIEDEKNSVNSFIESPWLGEVIKNLKQM